MAPAIDSFLYDGNVDSGRSQDDKNKGVEEEVEKELPLVQEEGSEIAIKIISALIFRNLILLSPQFVREFIYRQRFTGSVQISCELPRVFDRRGRQLQFPRQMAQNRILIQR